MGCNRVCKPGSVLDSHLSCRTVAGTLCATSSETAGPANVSSTVLLRIEFTASDSLQPTGELLPRLSTLTPRAGRYISVALFLKSPSAGVTRYPCPVEPGLSSQGAFRPACATARPGCRGILARFSRIVNLFLSKMFSCRSGRTAKCRPYNVILSGAKNPFSLRSVGIPCGLRFPIFPNSRLIIVGTCGMIGTIGESPKKKETEESLWEFCPSIIAIGRPARPPM